MHSGAGQKCRPCKKRFPDAMSLNVHNLKEHPISYKCTQCGNTFKDKSLLYTHALNTHTEKKNKETFKCIACKDTCESEAELTKHYEDKHITIKPRKEEAHKTVKCRNGQNCRYLKDNRCDFQHENTRISQPRVETQSKKQSSVHPRREQPRNEEKKREHTAKEQPWRTVQPRRQHRESNQEKQQTSGHKLAACLNGPSCKFLRDERCRFFHSQAQEQPRQHRQEERHPSGLMRNAPPTQLRQCKWGAKCDKGRTCGFLHLATDFFPSQVGRRN